MAEKKRMRASASTKERERTTRKQPRGGRRDTERETQRESQRETQRDTRASERSSERATRGREPAPMHEREPKPPFPPQHQKRPGIEAKIEPRPRYKAPTYRPAGKLEGKIALVTGGDSGIGRAVAVLYAREGADVAIVFLPVEEVDAKETQRAVEAEGRRCLLIPGDVTDSRFCRQAVERTVRELGGLDVLVNNAAFQKHQESIEEITDEQWDHTFRTNIHGYFYMAKAALEHLNEGDAIINCGSITGLEGSKELLDYSATKGAIHAFTKSLAQNLVDRNIRVNCVAPGPVWTPLNVADKEAKEAGKHGADVPMKRPAQPEEVAPAFVFFASDADSSYITGEVLTLLGGETTAG
ncbi:MAG TPA: SDR family oxidoreductase [Gemmatimonadaceae bacterium]|nr:SDR family oxidoreductase [Gemmatimonadaceae bacterium]